MKVCYQTKVPYHPEHPDHKQCTGFKRGGITLTDKNGRQILIFPDATVARFVKENFWDPLQLIEINPPDFYANLFGGKVLRERCTLQSRHIFPTFEECCVAERLKNYFFSKYYIDKLFSEGQPFKKLNQKLLSYEGFRASQERVDSHYRNLLVTIESSEIDMSDFNDVEQSLSYVD